MRRLAVPLTMALVAACVGLQSERVDERGLASWYGGSLRGQPTASGEPFDPDQLTAAHRTHAFGTVLRVTAVETGEVVEVRVNDRGPFDESRILDLSRAAAERLGFVDEGVTEVTITVVTRP